MVRHKRNGSLGNQLSQAIQEKCNEPDALKTYIRNCTKGFATNVGRLQRTGNRMRTTSKWYITR